MQGYNQYYQTPASMQAGPSTMRAYSIDGQQATSGYKYASQPNTVSHYYNSEAIQSPLRPEIALTHPSASSSSSSASSYPGPSLSPTSYRSSISSSLSLHTPITPLDLNSPSAQKDGLSQSSWFGAMQDSYLANKGQQRPALQRMSRMSASGPIQQQKKLQQSPSYGQQSGQYLNVDDQPARRASVATFQPTPARPSAAPRRPSMQTSANSDPLVRTRSPQYRLQTMQRGQPARSVMQPSTPQADDVERLYAEVFGQQSNPSTAQQMPTASSGQSTLPMITTPAIYSPIGYASASQDLETYNFAGVILQPEDLHMLGPELMSPTSTELPAYPQGPSPVNNSGWQTSFSLSVPQPGSPQRLQPALPIESQNAAWNFSSFHGLHPFDASSNLSHPCERALSAPLRDEANFYFTDVMDRRRGSSVDSGTMLPCTTGPSVLQPYTPDLNDATSGRMTYDPHSVFGPQSNLAMRRSTVGPSALKLAIPLSQYPSTPSPQLVGRTIPYPPASAPSAFGPPTTPTTPPRRYAGRSGSGGSRKGSGGAAPMFINFTSKDANKLLSGVAPSGSSKRKRDEEEAKNNAKQARMEGVQESVSPCSSPIA